MRSASLHVLSSHGACDCQIVARNPVGGAEEAAVTVASTHDGPAVRENAALRRDAAIILPMHPHLVWPAHKELPAALEKRRRAEPFEQPSVPMQQAAAVKSPIPNWDAARRILTLGGRLVKWFRVPAANQEAILAAFQEEGWPPRIDDPLRPDGDQNPKQRLHDTIKRLNGPRRGRIIRFVGDGTGQGVKWELTGD